MNRIHHPNIVGTREIPDEAIDKNARLPVLCMEYCKKGDLRNVNEHNLYLNLNSRISNLNVTFIKGLSFKIPAKMLKT